MKKIVTYLFAGLTVMALHSCVAKTKGDVPRVDTLWAGPAKTDSLHPHVDY